MDSQTKSKWALTMLPLQPRTILLTLLMIAALTMMAQTKKVKNDIENSKKNLEKIKRSKCLTSYIIKKECKKYAFKKREKNDSKNSKKNLEKIKRSKCLTSYMIKKECKKDTLKKKRKKLH